MNVISKAFSSRVLLAIAAAIGLLEYPRATFAAEARPKHPSEESQPPPLLPTGEIEFRGERIPLYIGSPAGPAVQQVPPKYPSELRRAGITGEAVVLAYVETNGRVLEAEVLSDGKRPEFGSAAKEAMLQWRFMPIEKAGQTIRYLARYTIVFVLSG